jgi:hypothetical protein
VPGVRRTEMRGFENLRRRKDDKIMGTSKYWWLIESGICTQSLPNAKQEPLAHSGIAFLILDSLK